MQKRTIQSLICLVSVAFLFTACGAKGGGEAKAKKLGVDTIKQMFSVEESETMDGYFENAEVKQLSEAGATATNAKKSNDYSVTVKNDAGATLYYVEVNIKSGKVKTIQQNPSFLKLTEEEEKMAANMSTSGIFDATVKNKAPKQAGRLALNWVKERFEPNGEFSTQSAGQAYQNKDYPARAFFDSTIVMQSKNVYSVTVCWPTMDVVQVTVMDQDQ